MAVCTGHEGDRLQLVSLVGEDESTTLFQDASLGQLAPTDLGCILVASTGNRPPRIIEFDFDRQCAGEPVNAPGPLIAEGYSQPESLRCQTSGGEDVWGYYYPPYNPQVIGPSDKAPPLLVMVHGGPTARTNRAFHPLRQYFPTLGFAVLDVNHRGSTGYGRRYRQRLLGGWGDVDAEDIICCVDRLVTDGLADPEAVFIRGGSAGGYSVLRALTRYPERFAGGAG